VFLLVVSLFSIVPMCPPHPDYAHVFCFLSCGKGSLDKLLCSNVVDSILVSYFSDFKGHFNFLKIIASIFV